MIPTSASGIEYRLSTAIKPDALYAITPGWPGRKLVLYNVKVPDKAMVTMHGVPGSLTINTPNLGPDQAHYQHFYVLRINDTDALPEKNQCTKKTK